MEDPCTQGSFLRSREDAGPSRAAKSPDGAATRPRPRERSGPSRERRTAHAPRETMCRAESAPSREARARREGSRSKNDGTPACGVDIGARTPGCASRTTGSEEEEGACLRRRGGRRAGGGRARRRGWSRSRSRACASGEGPMGGRRESERSVWRASRSEGSPGRRRVLTSKPWVERF